jgi:hypothetical protein
MPIICIIIIESYEFKKRTELKVEPAESDDLGGPGQLEAGGQVDPRAFKAGEMRGWTFIITGPDVE